MSLSASFLARSLVLLSLLLGAGGCGPTFRYRDPDVKVFRVRTVALPPVARAFKLDGGRMVAHPELAREMELHLGASTARLVRSGVSRPLTAEDLTAHGPAFAAFADWATTTVLEIFTGTRGDEVPPPTTVADWQFQGDLGAIRAALDADFVLALVFQDVWGVPPRALTGGLIGEALIAASTGEPPLARHQYGAFCIASLTTGRMVWCGGQIDKWMDLSKPEHAEFAVTHLLADVYGRPARRPADSLMAAPHQPIAGPH